MPAKAKAPRPKELADLAPQSKGKLASVAEPDSMLKRLIHGRESDFGGVAFISVGLLLILAVYFHVAGPLGRAITSTLGWLVGVGRFLVPGVLIALGVALVRRGSIEHRLRLAAGWVAVCWTTLGFAHLFNGPEKFSASMDDLKPAGGWLGALLAAPLRGAIGGVGAFVVLVALMVGAVVLVTGLTVPALVKRVRELFHNVGGPVGRGAKKMYNEVSTLSSERPSTSVSVDQVDSAFSPPTAQVIDVAGQPALYDFESDSSELGKKAGKAPVPKPKPADKPTQPMQPSFPPVQQEFPMPPSAFSSTWVLPTLDVLRRTQAQVVDSTTIDRQGQILQDSLAAHGVETKLVGRTVGPTVTRYELEIGPGVKVARVTSLNRDIAYALAAVDVRILAPIPGMSAIGVEVPNQRRELVSLGDLMGSPEAKVANHPLDVAIGKDIAGRSVFLNLATTPHLLIAGATGAGKSSGLNCIITSLLMRSTPEQVRLILIDPKQVEMGQYGRLPHLLTEPVTNPKLAANALKWAVTEMEKRYDLLVEVGYRDVTGYNAAYDRGDLPQRPEGQDPLKRLPYIVVVVDELNDLMMVAARDVEDSITRIAQKARAVGIHLIVATQRPSVNVITGVIKANIPARMAFAVASLTDSRVILDQPGAEKLVGQGDMLLLPGNSSVAQRIQGSWVTEDEVRKVVKHWRDQTTVIEYTAEVTLEAKNTNAGGLFGGGGDDDDDLLPQAIELVIRSRIGSTSMLQRKLKVGFARAGRLMDLLEERGIVGPSEGSKAREVLMTVEEYELLQDGNN